MQFDIIRQDRYSRGLAVLGSLALHGRSFALIPVFILLALLGPAAYLLAWFMQFVVLGPTSS